MATLNEISERVGVLQNTVSSLLDNPLVSAMKKTRRRVLCTCGWIGYHNMFHLSIEVLDARPSAEELQNTYFAKSEVVTFSWTSWPGGDPPYGEVQQGAA